MALSDVMCKKCVKKLCKNTWLIRKHLEMRGFSRIKKSEKKLRKGVAIRYGIVYNEVKRYGIVTKGDEQNEKESDEKSG